MKLNGELFGHLSAVIRGLHVFGKTQRGVSERPKPTKTSTEIPFWVWLFLLILIGACLAIFLSLWRPWQPVTKTDPALVVALDQEVNKDYRFYDLLPKQQVTPIPEQAIPEQQAQRPVVVVEAPAIATPPITLATSSDALMATEAHYILQVKSFQDPDSADAKRAEIALNGLSADVIISHENQKIWYRVISGPYPSQESAKIAQQTLQNGGIDSIIVKQAVAAKP
jgi:cell division protein FtsN